MLRRDLLKSSLATGLAAAISGRSAASGIPAPATNISSDRSFWLDQMRRVTQPAPSACSYAG